MLQQKRDLYRALINVAFTNKLASPDTFPGIAYHEATDRRSWQAMVDLFNEVF